VTHFSLRETALAGLIAAVYAVLGLAFLPISFGVYQIRVAEALTVLPFLTRAAIPGLFVGCLIANMFGGMGWQDIVFGSLLTLFAAVLTRQIYHFSRSHFNVVVVATPVAVVWLGGLILLNQTRTNWFIIISSLASIPFGVLAVRLWLLRRNRQFPAIVLGIVSLGWLTAGLTAVNWAEDTVWVPLVGVLALMAAWGMTWILTWLWTTGDNPNILLAPLPPVLINAFGVSLYLAPMAGFDYWFSVQMVGVGQLIACYLLGLPLLRLLQKRPWLLRSS